MLVVFALGLAACVRTIPAPELVEPNASFASLVRPILEQRCLVCHSCYNSPCQLNLQSYEGMDRGANKEQIYQPSRLAAVVPSRMFQDALTTEDWVKRFKFFPVLSHNKRPADSVLYHFLVQRRAEPITGDFSAEQAPGCPDSVAQAQSYLKGRPEAGMPYGFPPLDDAQFAVIEKWLAAGAPGPLPEPAPPGPTQAAIAQWEKFFNADDLRSQLVARYLYEHLFLAHLHFTSPTRDFYRLVRSRTAAPVAVDEIVTVRPYDDPRAPRVHYRFVRVVETIVQKTHVPFELTDRKLERFQELFLGSKWTIAGLPSWEPEIAGNPFIAFAAIPARARYQFMLDDAHYHVRAFIHGPVCRGQVALNVIDDHFWIMFTAPDADLSVTDPEFLGSTAGDLRIPAEGGGGLEAFYTRFKISQLRYITRRNALYDRSRTQGRALTDLWDGGGRDRSAILTVYRHFDSASVVLGALGAVPKTAWVMDYPIFERIYYDLVGGFDVFGNVIHQVSTRQYMDNLRIESEDGFLQFLPKAERPTLRGLWYRGAGLEQYMAVANPLFGSTRESRMVFKDPARAKEEFWDQVKTKYLAPAVLGDARQPPAALRALADVAQPFTQVFPDLTRLRVGDDVYSIIRNRGHANVAFMFQEEKFRRPAEDTLGIVRGHLGSYPNLFLVVPPQKLGAFVQQLSALNGGDQSWAAFLDEFGVRRRSPDFWTHADWFAARQVRDEPIDGGLLDLSRYLND